MSRTTQADLGAQGETAIAGALRSLGHRATAAPEDTGWDLIATVDGIEIPIEIKAASVINPETVARMVAPRDQHETSVARVAVGDLITGPARQALRDAGWGWLDRRGHLVLRTKGVHIDADVPADTRPTTGAPATRIVGTAAISWAVALLLAPQDPPPMREVARRVSLSHSAIVAASKRLKAASLIRADGRPLVPELFWALAEEWHPRPVALAQLPPPAEAGTYGGLGVNLEGDGPGWAVAGTVGAVAWGAPVVIGNAYPPDFYVPSAVELRQATLRLGEASRFEVRACTVAVAPTPLVCAQRFERDSEWKHVCFAHGLFAALDLAQDRARGAEILAGWNPTDFTRVW
jgi:hypothetical protein